MKKKPEIRQGYKAKQQMLATDIQNLYPKTDLLFLIGVRFQSIYEIYLCKSVLHHNEKMQTRKRKYDKEEISYKRG